MNKFVRHLRKVRLKEKFSNLKNMQQFYHTVVELNSLLDVVSYI